MTYEGLFKYMRGKNEVDQKKRSTKNLRENEVKYCHFTNFRKFRG